MMSIFNGTFFTKESITYQGTVHIHSPHCLWRMKSQESLHRSRRISAADSGDVP